MTQQPVSQRTSGSQSSDDVVKPPIPKWMYRFVNPTMAALLRSPLHRILSDTLLLLSFQGIKSGKGYTIPIGYMQQGQHLYIFSHSKWWKNLPGQQVTLRLRGRDLRGTVSRLEDPQEIAKVVRMSVEQRGEKMAERMGLMEYANPNRSGPLPQRTKFFEITLDEVAG